MILPAFPKIYLDTPSRVDGMGPSMKIVASLSSLKSRHPACKVVRRKGRIYVINKVAPRFKARQR